MSEQIVAREALPPPSVINLSKGDVLYIPRGWIYEAESCDESSLHLTLGIFPPQWKDFVGKALIDLTMKEERLRRALPIGYLDKRNAKEILASALRELAQLLEEKGSAAEALSLLQDDFIRIGRPIADGQFVSSLDRIGAIDLQTYLVKRPHLRCRVLQKEGSVALQFSRSIVNGTQVYKEAMDFMVRRREAFQVAEIPIDDAERKILFAQRLLRDGLLRFGLPRTR